MKWATTADKDGDLAVFTEDGCQLVGVAATVRQALNFVQRHNEDIDDAHRERKEMVIQQSVVEQKGGEKT